MLEARLPTPAPNGCQPTSLLETTYHPEKGSWLALLRLSLSAAGLKSLPGARPSS